MRKFGTVPAGAFVLCILAASLTRAANWPQWRGSAGTGVSTETRLPADWSSEKNIRWKTPIPGRGHSSPIVWGKRSYASSTPATDGAHVYAWFGSEGLYCYDFSGKLIWKSSLGPVPQMGMGTGT